MRGRSWIVGLVALGAACSSSGKSSSVTPPLIETTVASSTVPTTAVATTTTEVPLATDCVDAPASLPRFEFVDERDLDTFGPLSETPSLQLKLHAGESTAGVELAERIVTTVRIPGGILLSADAMNDQRALLTAIDADGTRRWTHCFDAGRNMAGVNMFVAPPNGASPTQALVLSYVQQIAVGEVAPEWLVIDLASGDTVGPLAALFAEQGVDVEGIDGSMLAWSADSILFGPASDAVVDVTSDHLVRVELETMTATSIPLPDSLAGRQLFEVQFGFTEGGDLAIVEYEYGLPTPKMVFAQGVWQQGEAVTAQLPPIRVGESFGDDGTMWLVGIDPMGNEVWRVTEISLANDEGFRHALSGDVTVMSGCTSFVEFVCERTTAGIDTATGEILWTNASYGGPLAVGDGFALVVSITAPGDSGTRIMIDTRTGEPIGASQQWSPNEYYLGCCGDESHWVLRSGAVVIARVDDVIEVWYPAGVAPPTRTVPIP